MLVIFNPVCFLLKTPSAHAHGQKSSLVLLLNSSQYFHFVNFQSNQSKFKTLSSDSALAHFFVKRHWHIYVCLAMNKHCIILVLKFKFGGQKR